MAQQYHDSRLRMQAFQAHGPPRRLLHAAVPLSSASINAPRRGSRLRGGSAAGEAARLTGDGYRPGARSRGENSVHGGDIQDRTTASRPPGRHATEKAPSDPNCRSLLQDHSSRSSSSSGNGSGKKSHGSSRSVPPVRVPPSSRAVAAKGGATAVPWRHGAGDMTATEHGAAATLQGGTKECEGGRMRGDEGRNSNAWWEGDAAAGEEQAVRERERERVRVAAGTSAMRLAGGQRHSPSATERMSPTEGRCSASADSTEAVGREGGEDEAGAGRPPPCLRILLIDNYDSYTYNLAHLLTEVNGGEAGARAVQ